MAPVDIENTPVCCEGEDRPMQANQGNTLRGANTDWFFTIYAEQRSPNMQVDGAEFTHTDLHRSLKAAFGLSYAETTTRLSKRTKTAHIHSNAKFPPPGPRRADLKDWATDKFPAQNKITMNPITSWDNIARWSTAGQQTTVFGAFEAPAVPTTIESVQRAMTESNDTRNRRHREMFDAFEIEGPEPPMGYRSMWGSIPDSWSVPDVVNFLRHHAAYIQNTNMYIMRKYNHERKIYELDVYSRDTARSNLEKIAIEFREADPETGTVQKRKYTGVDYMTGPDILTYAAAIFNPSSPHPKLGTVDEDYLDPTHRVFNLFRGFPYKYNPDFRYTGPDSPDIPFLKGRFPPSNTAAVLAKYGVSAGHPVDLFLSHAFEILCAGDETCFDYLISWVAHVFQHPASKPGTAILVRSVQGTGKNIWFNVLKPLVGKQYFVDIKNKEHISGKFNSHLSNKLFAVVDECVFGGAHEVNNLIKSLITQEESVLEKKGVDAVQSTTYERYAFLSNEDWPIKIEPSDRRFICLEASPLRVGQMEYYSAFVQHHANVEVQDALYQFLINVPNVPATMPRPPSTELHRELMEKSLPLEVQFLRDLANEADGVAHLAVEDGSWVTTEGMVERMREWANANGLDGARVVGSKKLGSYLKKVMGERKSVDTACVAVGRPVSVRTTAYNFDRKVVLAYK